MKRDITLKIDDGFVNVRVGAIIISDGKFLMAGNENVDYLYSVGGRVKFGETAEEAVIREVFEETGVKMEIDHLGFIHENYFRGDSYDMCGKLIYEISFYFYMKVPENFTLRQNTFYEGSQKEFLKWVSSETDTKFYPVFFAEELSCPSQEIKHFITDGR